MEIGISVILFLLSYGIGISSYLIETHMLLFYIIGIFLYINTAKMFHPFVYYLFVMRPLQLSLSSSGLLSLFNGNFSMFLFWEITAVILIFIEKEKENLGKVLEKMKKKRIKISIAKLAASSVLPLSVTYIVLLFEPNEEILPLSVAVLYFASMYVVSKWFVNNFFSMAIFTVLQILVFYYAIETYLHWDFKQIATFLGSVALFLLIGYFGKGFSGDKQNINNIRRAESS